MKKKSQNTGVEESAKFDYFEYFRNTEPIESFDSKEFRRRIEASRKEKEADRKQ